MKIGLGHLNHAPAVFWSMTPREFFAAIDGYVERKGGGKRKNDLTHESVDELMQYVDSEGNLLSTIKNE